MRHREYAPLTPKDVARFWSKVVRADDPNECWSWTGAHFSTTGYAMFTRKFADAARWQGDTGHRVSYLINVGPIPNGLVIDHLCRNRGCVNPAHLEPVTRGENVLRGESLSAQQARQTHCIRGHEFTPENTYRKPGKPNKRECRECNRMREKARNRDWSNGGRPKVA